MSLHWEQELPTRRVFGIWYLAGIGILLDAGLVAYGVFSDESDLVVLLCSAIAIPLIGAVFYMGYTFHTVDVSEDLVWTVAQWTALGLAVATLLSLVVGFGSRFVPESAVVNGLVVVTITAGGLVGALVGVVCSLGNQNDQLRELRQRNAVLNRVLRHNIKNDMNVIIGHATLLDRRVEGSAERSVSAIHRAAEEVTRLSETARALDELMRNPGRSTIDLAVVAEECVESADHRYANAEFDTDLAASAWVDASPLVRSVVTNLLENAVEHNEGHASVSVTVHAPDGDDGRVRLAVADDGPGIHEHEREILEAEREGSIRHGSGLGLWLVKWFTEHYDGDLRFEDNEPTGTVVRISLPAADEHPESQS